MQGISTMTTAPTSKKSEGGERHGHDVRLLCLLSDSGRLDRRRYKGLRKASAKGARTETIQDRRVTTESAKTRISIRSTVSTMQKDSSRSRRDGISCYSSLC